MDGCEVVGVNLDYRHHRQGFYLTGTLGHFTSRDTDDPRGNPLLQSTTFALGIGKMFGWRHETNFSIEALFKIQADDDFGNSNFNSGVEVKLRLDKGFADYWRVGAEIALQRFQNCSHPDCHRLGASKPVMKNIMGAIHITRRISDQWGLGYRIFDVISYPDRDRYNGRNTEFPGQMLTLSLFLE